MRFCEDHWTRLREAIEERGLGHLIAQGGELAAAQFADQLKRVAEGEPETTAVNYDPLMASHWAIINNVLSTIPQATGYLMQSDDVPEDRVQRDHGAHALRYTSRTWPRCPLCYLNLAHAISCTDSRCKLPRKDGYDWMLDRAADDAKEKAGSLDLL